MKYTANGWKNLHRRPWPETRIFIEMDSACRNQQGNCDEVEFSARPFLLFFFSIVVEFMQKQRSNIVFQCINVCQVPRELLKTSAFGLGFQQLPRDLANVNAWKTMFDPYIGLKIKYFVLCLYWTLWMTRFRNVLS